MFIRLKTLNRIRKYLLAYYLTSTGYLVEEQEKELYSLCKKLKVFKIKDGRL